MTTEQLNRLLRKHKLWLKGYMCGKYLDLSYSDLSDAILNCADLSHANLRGADLSNVDLSHANLSYSDLRGVDLRGADLSNVDLSHASLSYANLRGVDLSNVDLSHVNLSHADLSHTSLSYTSLNRTDLSYADLSHANLSNADLRGADLRGVILNYADLSHVDLNSADLRGADLSQAKNLLSPIDYLEKNFEKTKDGYIVYKIFSLNHNTTNYWKIEENSIIKENVDTDRTIYRSYGINVGTLKYVRELQNHTASTIYKLLIKYEWLAGIVVPYNTNGLIRCERAMILNKVN